jgi:hypothetical protein
MEGTLPPSCKNHGANIGSVRYRQAAMRVIEQRIAARHAEILAVLATSAASTSSGGGSSSPGTPGPAVVHRGAGGPARQPRYGPAPPRRDRI